MIIILFLLAIVALEVMLSSKVKKGGWQPFKLFQMTPKKMKSIGIVLLLVPVSIVVVFSLVAMNFLIQYILLFQMIIIFIGSVPFVVTTIRFFLAKKIPIKFYPVLSIAILSMIVMAHLLMIISVPIDAFTARQASRLPEITTGEFPFRIVYELDGEIHVMEDVLICEFAGLRSYGNRGRSWRWRLRYDSFADQFDGFRDDLSILQGEYMYSIFGPYYFMNERFNIFVDPGSCARYMGERGRHHRGPIIQINERRIIAENEDGRRTLSTQDADINHEQLETHFGIRIIEFSFSDPIENQFN